MKTFIKTLFFLALVIVAFFRFGPIDLLEKIPSEYRHWTLTFIRPELFPTLSISSDLPPPKVIKSPMPYYGKSLDDALQLVSTAKFGSTEAYRAKVNLKRLHHLNVAGEYVTAIDLQESAVVVLSPELKFIRKWQMFTSGSELLKLPVAMVANVREVAVIDEKGKLVWWNLKGERQGTLEIEGKPHDIDFLTNGDFLVHRTSPAPYVLAAYDRSGRLIREFAPERSVDPVQGEALNQGFAAVNARNEAAFCLINPYRLYFFHANGRAKNIIEFEPVFKISPPVVEMKNGRVKSVIRQRIVYDLVWNKDELYVLVAPETNRAASWLEIFDRDGEMLHRFALTLNALKIGVYEDDIILHGYYPDYRIERFKMVKFAQAQQ